MSERTSGDRQVAVNRGRHEKFCTMCKHPKREEIERDFINWRALPRLLGSIDSQTAGRSTVTHTSLRCLRRGAGTCERHWNTSSNEREQWK